MKIRVTSDEWYPVYTLASADEPDWAVDEIDVPEELWATYVSARIPFEAAKEALRKHFWSQLYPKKIDAP